MQHQMSIDGTINTTRKPEHQAVEEHPLEPVLRGVLNQVRKGKGERHGGDTIPFWEQTWAVVVKDHGHGFLTGQAQKKIMEAVQSPIDASTEAFERELMGAIAYLGMAILYIQKYGR